MLFYLKIHISISIFKFESFLFFPPPPSPPPGPKVTGNSSLKDRGLTKTMKIEQTREWEDQHNKRAVPLALLFMVLPIFLLREARMLWVHLKLSYSFLRADLRGCHHNKGLDAQPSPKYVRAKASTITRGGQDMEQEDRL